MIQSVIISIYTKNKFNGSQWVNVFGRGGNRVKTGNHSVVLRTPVSSVVEGLYEHTEP
jgi:hypothetical protein